MSLTFAFMASCALLLLFLPVIVLIFRAIETRGWQAMQSAGVTDAILLSLSTASASVTLTVIFGTPLAYLLARQRFRLRWLVNLIVELPIVLPPAVAGLALLVTFGRRGFLGPVLDDLGINIVFTTTAVIIAQTFVAAPFYIRAAHIGFSEIPSEVEDAARVDGAGTWAVFRFMTLPLARRALIAGGILSWTRALGEFGATILFAGSLPGITQTMPLLVYNVLERDLSAALWAGVILVIVAMIALVIARTLLQQSHDEPLNY